MRLTLNTYTSFVYNGDTYDLKDKISTTSVHVSPLSHPLKVVVTRMVTQVLFKRKQKEDRRKEKKTPSLLDDD